MIELFGLQLGTIFQGGTLAAAVGLVALVWRTHIVTTPARTLAEGEARKITAKIEEDLRGEAAERFSEFRKEVHGLRNELALALSKVTMKEAESMRRAAKVDMLVFILKMLMDEFRLKDPKNKVLAQVRVLLSRVDDEPHQLDASDALNRAEDTVDAAKATVREVKASEAKGDGK